MPDPAIQKLCADFHKPNKPVGWQEYNLTRPEKGFFERTDSLAAEMRADGVTIVHKMSVDDYHVQTVLAEGITDLDAEVIEEMLDEQRPAAKRQLPKPKKRPHDAKGRFLPAED